MAQGSETERLMSEVQDQRLSRTIKPQPYGLWGEGIVDMVRPDKSHTNGANLALRGEKAYQGGPSAADRMDL